MSFPTPSKRQLADAFRDHAVTFVEHRKVSAGRDAWANGLRAATVHHTAGKDSADYLATHWSLPGANVVINHGRYNGRDVDGRAVVLSWGSCWHSGDGGPWRGVAGKDSLHLVSWGIEIESLGTRPDMTDAQLETVGRMLAALVDLGMPAGNIHRHADWTDGTGPVKGASSSTRGRKIDTRREWYPTSRWVELAATYGRRQLWDGHVPAFDELLRASRIRDDVSIASWRLACRLADLGHYQGTPKPRGEQGYPRHALSAWRKAHGYDDTDPPGGYGRRTHELVWG